MDAEQLVRFLDAIKQVESSGGKNLNHPVIESGIHAGQSAIGSYGLMPNTIKEIKKRFPASVETNNEDILARKLAEYIAKKTGNDKEAMAASWFYGHNLPPERLEKLKSSSYVKKVMDAFSKLPKSDYISRAKVTGELKPEDIEFSKRMEGMAKTLKESKLPTYEEAVQMMKERIGFTPEEIALGAVPPIVKTPGLLRKAEQKAIDALDIAREKAPMEFVRKLVESIRTPLKARENIRLAEDTEKFLKQIPKTTSSKIKSEYISPEEAIKRSKFMEELALEAEKQRLKEEAIKAGAPFEKTIKIGNN